MHSHVPLTAAATLRAWAHASVYSATTWEGVQTSSGPPSETPGVGPPPCSRKMVVAPDRPHLLVAQGVAGPPVDHGDGVALPGSSLVANGIRGVLVLRLPSIECSKAHALDQRVVGDRAGNSGSYVPVGNVGTSHWPCRRTTRTWPIDSPHAVQQGAGHLAFASQVECK